ncbi:MAG: sulfatase [Opitutales bacterium]|nr:sulfatase [Opitutales bacterium]
MKIRNFQKRAMQISVVLSLLTFTHAFGDDKRNVLLILVDDLGWTDLGCYGSAFYDTPHIDEFASNSTKFTNAYSASPVCSPSRAAIMTGKAPHRMGLTDWIPGFSTTEKFKRSKWKLNTPSIPNALSKDEKTISEVLREKGYRTFFAGKWHLGETESDWPEHHGFETNAGGISRGSPLGIPELYPGVDKPHAYYTPYLNPRLSDGPPGECITDRLTNECIDFLKAQKDEKESFFMMLSFYTVHSPVQAIDRWVDYYEGKLTSLDVENQANAREEGKGITRISQDDVAYATLVRTLDENVGRLLSELSANELDKNTLVIFVSDNGGWSTRYADQPGRTSVVPLRAGKGWCYEGGIRVPLIIRNPLQASQNDESSMLTTSMDLYPTILDFVGHDMMPEQHCDGISILQSLSAKQSEEDRSLVWHFPHYHNSAWTPGSAIREGKWKLVEFYEDSRVELYNLEIDLSERNNLAEIEHEKARQLRDRLHELLRASGAKYPTVAAE